jgi:hypothetical protein
MGRVEDHTTNVVVYSKRNTVSPPAVPGHQNHVSLSFHNPMRVYQPSHGGMGGLLSFRSHFRSRFALAARWSAVYRLITINRKAVF